MAGIEQKATGKMRSSIGAFGAPWDAFARRGVYSPGGCMIGKRPIDWHLRALRALGRGNTGTGAGRLPHVHRQRDFAGQRDYFPFPSVGAVENGHVLLCRCGSGRGGRPPRDARNRRLTAVPFPKWWAGASIRGIGDGMRDHRRRGFCP
ncbi:MAG: hypothetical protein ACLT76_01290 [Clostridium fessum]